MSWPHDEPTPETILKLTRMGLVEHARICCRHGMTAAEWLEDVRGTDDAELLGARAIAAIASLTWTTDPGRWP